MLQIVKNLDHLSNLEILDLLKIDPNQIDHTNFGNLGSDIVTSLDYLTSLGNLGLLHIVKSLDLHTSLGNPART